MLCTLQTSQVFPLGVRILKQSRISLPRHIVRIADRLLCVSTVDVIKHHCITFPSIHRLLSPPHVVSPYHSNKTHCNPSVTQNLFSWNMLVCAADSSGLIWKSPHDDLLWCWVANLCKCCNWVVFTGKRILWRTAAVATGWVHKNVNHYGTWCLDVAINTVLWMH